MSTEETTPPADVAITPLDAEGLFKQGYDELAAKDILEFLAQHPTKELLNMTLEYEKKQKKRPTVIEQCERLLSVVEKVQEAEKDKEKEKEKDPSISTAKTEEPPAAPPLGLVDPAAQPTLEVPGPAPSSPAPGLEKVQIRIVQTITHYPQIGKFRWLSEFGGRKPTSGETYRVPRYVAEHLVQTHFAVITY